MSHKLEREGTKGQAGAGKQGGTPKGRAKRGRGVSTPMTSCGTARLLKRRETKKRTSAAQRVVSVKDQVVQHPGERYVAVRPRTHTYQTLSYRLFVINPAKLVQGPEKVEIAVFSWSNVSGSWKKGRRLTKKTMKVLKAGSQLEIPWPHGYDGSRVLLVFSVRDKDGRVAKTARIVSRPSKPRPKKRPKPRARKATPPRKGSRRTSNRSKKKLEPRPKLEIVTDKSRYLPGEKARILVKRRHLCGAAMLLLERERVFRKIPLEFTGERVTTGPGCKGKPQRAVVKVEAKKQYARSVTLRVVSVRAGKELRGRSGPYVIATDSLRISPKPFYLDVDLETTKKEYEPRDRVGVKVKVTDGLKRSRKARVVLMAVDEAVLALTRYTLPNPLSTLFHSPPSQVHAEDLRRYLAPLAPQILHLDHVDLTTPEPHTGYGAGFGMYHYKARRPRVFAGRAMVRGGRKKKKRKLFLTTAWHATVVTDEQGRAETSFRLPDNLTTYRIMAFAVGKDRSAGVGRTKLRVNLPLLALPSFPRFVRKGDRFHGGLTLHNQSLGDGVAKVTLRVEGARFLGHVGSKKKIVSVEKRLKEGSDTRVTFPLQALEPGVVKLHVDISMNGHQDSLVHALTIKPRLLPETTAVSGSTKGAVRHQLGSLATVRPGYGGLQLRLASTALVGVEEGMEQLLEYPYGCLEQQVSRILPLLMATTLGKSYDLSVDLGTSPETALREGLQSVAVMQRPGGGFGYWPRSKTSRPWTTAYALVAYRRAILAGIITEDAAQPAIKAAVAYLMNHLSKPRKLGALWWSHSAFSLYAPLPPPPSGDALPTKEQENAKGYTLDHRGSRKDEE